METILILVQNTVLAYGGTEAWVSFYNSIGGIQGLNSLTTGLAVVSAGLVSTLVYKLIK